MGKHERHTLPEDPSIEVLREGDSLVLRKVVDVPKYREIAADVRAHFPVPVDGESILHDLHESRLRGGSER